MDRNPHELHALGLAERIHDRSRVHPQLDEEGKEDLQVAVLRGHGGDDGAEPKGETRDHDQHHRSEECKPIQVCLAGGINDRVDNIDDYKEPELDSESKEVADNVGGRHDQTGEIHFPKDAGILHEGIGRLGDTVGKVLP